MTEAEAIERAYEKLSPDEKAILDDLRGRLLEALDGRVRRPARLGAAGSLELIGKIGMFVQGHSKAK